MGQKKGPQKGNPRGEGPRGGPKGGHQVRKRSQQPQGGHQEEAPGGPRRPQKGGPKEGFGAQGPKRATLHNRLRKRVWDKKRAPKRESQGWSPRGGPKGGPQVRKRSQQPQGGPQEAPRKPQGGGPQVEKRSQQLRSHFAGCEKTQGVFGFQVRKVRFRRDETYAVQVNIVINNYSFRIH